jgi:membrane-associated phospholipid phosphatase
MVLSTPHRITSAATAFAVLAILASAAEHGSLSDADRVLFEVVRGAPVHVATLLAAACVGSSRVYLGVHWPADVAAGWLFAEGWLYLTAPEP